MTGTRAVEPAVVHLRESLEKYGGVPFEPDAPTAWSEGSVGWFAPTGRP